MSLAYPIPAAAFAGSTARLSSTAASKPATAEFGFADLLTAIQSEQLGQPATDTEGTVKLSELILTNLAAGQLSNDSEFVLLSDVLVLLSGTDGSEDWEQWLLQMEAVLANWVPDMTMANSTIPLSDSDGGSVPKHPAGNQQLTARLASALQQLMNPTPSMQDFIQAEADSMQTTFRSLMQTMPRSDQFSSVPSGAAGALLSPIQQQVTSGSGVVQMNSESVGTQLQQMAPRHPEMMLTMESLLKTDPSFQGGTTIEAVPMPPTRSSIAAELTNMIVMTNENAETQVQHAEQQRGSAPPPQPFGPFGLEHARNVGQPSSTSEQAPLPRLIHMNEFPQEMSRMIVKHFQFAKAGELSEARILLRPEQLGHVDIRLTLHNGQLIAQFIAETSVGRELLEQQIASLRTSLQSQGIQVEKLEVSQYYSSAGLFQEQRHHRQPGQHQHFQQNRKSPVDYDQWTNDLSVDADMEAMLSSFGKGNSLNVTA